MSWGYLIQTDLAMPETRGRKRGSRNRTDPARQAAIAKGVGLVGLGHSCVEAAKIVLADYPHISRERMTKLIRQARKDNDQTQSS